MPRQSCCFSPADPEGSPSANQLTPTPPIQGGGSNPTSSSSLQAVTAPQPQPQPQNQTVSLQGVSATQPQPQPQNQTVSLQVVTATQPQPQPQNQTVALQGVTATQPQPQPQNQTVALQGQPQNQTVSLQGATATQPHPQPQNQTVSLQGVTTTQPQPQPQNQTVSLQGVTATQAQPQPQNQTAAFQRVTAPQPQPHPQSQSQNQTETLVSIDELKRIFASPQTEEEHLLSVLNFVKQAISKLKHEDVASFSSSSLSGVPSDTVSRVPDFLQYLSTVDSMALLPDAEHHRATIQMLSGVLGVMSSLHWVFAGLSVVAYSLNQTLIVSSNQKEAINLLDELEILASNLVEFHTQFSSDNKTIKRAIEVIIKGTIACCHVDHCPRYIGKLYRFLFANASGDLLSSLCKEISSIDRALLKECNIEIMKRNLKVSSRNKPKYVEDTAVGLKTRVEDAMKLIGDEQSSTTTTPPSQSQAQPCALLLHGIGGIGKSTLLTALTSKLLDSRPNDGRIRLLKELKKLNQPVLIVIDNALKKEQLQELLPQGLNELKRGSIIIVTTRDADVGSELKNNGVMLVHNYEVLQLSNDESKMLLQKTMGAQLFKYMEEENLTSLIGACHGHPLALTIAASYINDEVEDIRRDLGGRCKYVVELINERRGEGMIGEAKLLDALAYSIASLPTDSKAAFFDIVFLLKYMSENSKYLLTRTVHMLRDKVRLSWDELREMAGVDTFDKLCNRSLINKTRDMKGIDRVSVHDLLQRLALNNMPEGSRLMSFEELQPLLQPSQQEKLKRIECLDVSPKSNRYLKENLRTDAWNDQSMFDQMDSLRLLIMPHQKFNDPGWQYKISPQARLQLFIGSNLQEFPLRRTDDLRLLYIFDSPRLQAANLFSSTSFNFASLAILKMIRSMANSTTLPADLWDMLPNIKCIRLDGLYSLTSLPHKSKRELTSGGLTRLQNFWLSGSKVLKTLPEDLFCNLPSLKTLSISNFESLEELPNRGMGEFTNLENLSLSGSKVLKTLPEDLFCNLPSLKTLSISNFESLEELPERGMGEFTNLENLSLSGSKVLKTLPEDLFCNLPSLKTLSISNFESLEELPKRGMGEFTNLENLSLSGSKVLKTLPEDLFCTLPSLKTLSISNFESLEELPERGMGEFTNLENLSLSGYKVLKTLPEDLFCNLPSLKTLSIFNFESLEELPKRGMGEFTNLENLSLSGYKVLKTLPEDLFCNLPSLKTLQIFGCDSLEELPKRGMGEFTRLESLTLSKCKLLKTLPEDLFCNLPSLKYLQISHCESLEELPKKGIGEFTSLERLSLSGCKMLKSIPEDLCNILSLKELDLSACESLEELSKERMGELTRLKKFLLPGSKP